MDEAMGTQREPSLSEVRAWLSQAPSLVALSIYERILEGILQVTKSAGFILVYLCKPKEQLTNHLSQPKPCGQRRPDCDQKYTLDSYDRLDVIFMKFAELVIDCSNKDITAVAAEVTGIMDRAGD